MAVIEDRRPWSRRLRNLEFILGAALTGMMVLAVLCAGLLFPDGGEGFDLTARLLPPFHSWAHPLGTDPVGRDVLARVVTGGGISLTVGFLSVAGAVVIGTIVGLVAGYYRGIWDLILMRCADVQLPLPRMAMKVMAIRMKGSASCTSAQRIRIRSQMPR